MVWVGFEMGATSSSPLRRDASETSVNTCPQTPAWLVWPASVQDPRQNSRRTAKAFYSTAKCVAVSVNALAAFLQGWAE